MRYLETRLVDDFISEQDEVEVERARGTSVRALAAELALDGQQLVEQRASVERGRAGDDGIEEQRLAGEHFPCRTLRVGFDDVREAGIEKDAGQAIQRKGHGGPPVSEVAAERDGDRPVGRRYCSIHRTGSTPPPVPAPSMRRPRRSVRPAAACSKKRLCSRVSPTITLSIVW